ALRWAAGVTDQIGKLSHVSDAIVLHALDHVEEVKIAESLAELLVLRVRKHLEMIFNFGILTKRQNFKQILHNEPHKRRILATAVIPLTVEKQMKLGYLLWMGVLDSRDASLYVSLFKSTKSKDEKKFILDLMEFMPLSPEFAMAVRPEIEE